MMKKILAFGLSLFTTISFSQDVSSHIVSSWGTGYNAEIKIQPQTDVTDWSVTVEYKGTINSLWNGVYIDSATSTSGIRRLIITPESYNASIDSGATVTIGFGAAVQNETENLIVSIDYTLDGPSITGDGDTTLNVPNLFWTGNGSKLLLNNQYNKVGLGTNNMLASYRLFVSGGILTDKIKVAREGSPDWPDYVFNDSYQLMKLSELEKYINTHHHLPNVLSATEVDKEGQDLAEMNRVLLEKVEELTLHVINLQKQINRLNEVSGN